MTDDLTTSPSDVPPWASHVLEWLETRLEEIDPEVAEPEAVTGARRDRSVVDSPTSPQVLVVRSEGPASLMPLEAAARCFEAPLRRSDICAGSPFYSQLKPLALAAEQRPGEGHNAQIIEWKEQYVNLVEDWRRIQQIIITAIGLHSRLGPEKEKEWLAGCGLNLIKMIHRSGNVDVRLPLVQRFDQTLEQMAATDIDRIFAGQSVEFIEDAKGFIAYMRDFQAVLTDAKAMFPVELLTPENPTRAGAVGSNPPARYR